MSDEKQPTQPESPRERASGERVRLRHSVERLRAQAGGIDKALKLNGPIGHEAAQAVVTSALEIAMLIARHDAFARCERDAADARQREMILEEMANPEAFLR